MKKSRRGQEAVHPDEEEVDQASQQTSPEELWRQEPVPVLEWWLERWDLHPTIRWVRPATHRVDAVLPIQPIDELASQAVHNFDDRSHDEFLKNSAALRLGLLRWRALAEVIAKGQWTAEATDRPKLMNEKWRDDFEVPPGNEWSEVSEAVKLISALTIVTSAALDRLRVPRIDPTPLWMFYNRAASDVGLWWNKQEVNSTGPSLSNLLQSASPIIDRVDALGLGERAVGDVYVCKEDVAGLLGFKPRTMERHSKKWGRPDLRHSGGAPDLWVWSRLVHVIRQQYPERDVPDIWPIDQPFTREVT